VVSIINLPVDYIKKTLTEKKTPIAFSCYFSSAAFQAESFGFVPTNSNPFLESPILI